MVGALVYIVTYWIRPTVNHDLRLLGSHDFTMFSYCIVYQPKKNTELMPKLVVALIWVKS